MIGAPDDYETTARLISSLLDERLAEKERLQLEVCLETDPDARRLYMQMVDQEVELACLVEPAVHRNILLMAAPRSAPSRRLQWWFAAAAVVAITTVWLSLESRQTPSPVDMVANAGYATWSEDFENGSADGWRGELVSVDLPDGSKNGIRAVADQKPEGIYYEIALPADWQDGVAALTGRSALHVTYRFGKLSSLNVFMHTLPEDPATQQIAMFKLDALKFPGVASQWQTATIPFSLFKRKVFDAASGRLEFAGGPPRTGELVAALIFSSPDELDLIIDRIWITRDGPGSESIQALP